MSEPRPASKVRALALIGTAAAAAYLASLAADASALGLVAKPVPVLCLAIDAAARPRRHVRWVAVGLLISAVADVAIEWSFSLGLVLFLLVHLAYTAAFVEGRPPLRPLLALPFLVAKAAGQPLSALSTSPCPYPGEAFAAPGGAAAAVAAAAAAAAVCAAAGRCRRTGCCGCLPRCDGH